MDARLVPVDPFLGISEVQLTERETTIGRSRQNDLCLDNPSVSRVHAVIRTVDGGYVIEDKGSLHGTIVNEKRVAVHHLNTNDLIQVGVYRFRFITSESGSPDVTVTAVQEEVDH